MTILSLSLIKNQQPQHIRSTEIEKSGKIYLA